MDWPEKEFKKKKSLSLYSRKDLIQALGKIKENGRKESEGTPNLSKSRLEELEDDSPFKKVCIILLG